MSGGRAAAGVDDDPLLFTFFTEIAIVEQLARNRLERVLPRGLSVAGFTLLNHCVRLGDGRSPVELARAFQVTKPTMTHTLRRLEEKGLVRLDADPRDRRGKRVRLTPSGRAARAEAVAAVGPELARIEAALGRDAFFEGLPFLRRLRAHLDAARD